MDKEDAIEAIAEIVESIPRTRPAGSISGRIQRDFLAWCFAEYLNHEDPREILMELMDAFQGFPVVERWRDRILQ